ncbi:ATP-dependent DNA helicase RecG [Candidatus Saccharibacteria bacterium]|nr:ATP-dependent DNA helicase RecG [Candidatus Saccharibacteria bacterium]
MDLTLPITEIKGIGEKTAAKLHKIGIYTLKDLIYTFPRDYANYQVASHISDIRPGKITVKAKIKGLTTRKARRRNLSITEGIIYDNTGSIRVVWFNQNYRTRQFNEKQEYYFQGVYDFKNGRYQLTSPSAALAHDIDSQSAFNPIYVAHNTLKSPFFVKLLANLRPNFAKIPDLLPNSPENPPFVKQGARAEALYQLHFPDTPEDVKKAREYLAYEELFEYILAAKLNRQANQKLNAPPLKFNAKDTREFVKSLPFKLTDAQRRATWDILQDLEKSTPMNRLLQGDVGAGKTVVAAIAAHQTAINHHQTALLAPTAILATQHADKLEKLLTPLGIKVALLTGATKHKSELKKRIKSGEIDLVVGTHALLTDDTQFHSLALCIIDEQHRFGVNQRQKLLLKSPDGLAPHLLSMTATPIPRSLQLTVFGDLDISVINQLPAGRQPITTKIIPAINQQPDLYPQIREIIKKRQQVYWICPSIEEDHIKETTSVKRQQKHLQTIFKDAKIGLLHGRMKPDEKDQVMTDFASHKLDILVSTTVVEVGVDVPNATAIVIMDAENYGLAQLHQLRGRVGRGNQPSFCYLITPADHASSRRLKEIEKSTDGFRLAEVDLKLRGPGEIYGSLQHGELNLNIANLADTHTIALASKYASNFAKHPDNMLKYKELSHDIKKYQQLTTLN